MSRHGTRCHTAAVVRAPREESLMSNHGPEGEKRDLALERSLEAELIQSSARLEALLRRDFSDPTASPPSVSPGQRPVPIGKEDDFLRKHYAARLRVTCGRWRRAY